VERAPGGHPGGLVGAPLEGAGLLQAPPGVPDRAPAGRGGAGRQPAPHSGPGAEPGGGVAEGYPEGLQLQGVLR